MRVLMVGPVTLGVSAAIEAGWAELTAMSRAFAEDRRDGRPYVHYRTDTGISGSLPLSDATPVTFADVETVDPGRFLGTIVSTLPGDPRKVGDDLMRRTPPAEDLDVEGIPEDERVRILNDLHVAAPHVDHTWLAAGTLAGGVTADRPDVPPWEYRQYAGEHPDTTLEDLVRVRFPEVFAEWRGSTVRSIAEDVDDYRLPPGTSLSVDEALDRWRFLYDAGVIRWDSDSRAVEHVSRLGDVFAAQHAWATKRRPGTGQTL